MRLQDRVCVVTGASSGIGAAVARRFARDGARLVLGARDEAKLVAVAKDCPDSLVKRLDVTDPASVASFANAVRDRHGRVDVLVSNAGVGDWGTVAEMTVETWDRVLATNLRGPFLVAKAFLPLLLPERPWPRTVVHTASVAGTSGYAGGGAYCASKAGLRMFSQSLAAEVSDKGVRVVCVNPGYVATPLVADDGVPAERMIQPEDLAEIYLDLATMPASAFVEEVNVWPTKMYSE